jgi:hypothetical protein
MRRKKHKPIKRVYQQPGCVVRAKINRLITHLKSHLWDQNARDRLRELAGEEAGKKIESLRLDIYGDSEGYEDATRSRRHWKTSSYASSEGF